MASAEKVRRYFNRNVVAFDSLYSETGPSRVMRFVNQRFRQDIYERFRLAMDHDGEFRPNSVLDVGCGSGQYALALVELGVRRMVGIDFSREMIDLAIRKTHQIRQGGAELEFVCADFMEFQTRERFDLVIAMGFFDYVKDPNVVLRKMKVLSKEFVVASFPSISVYRTPIRKIRYIVKRCPVYFYSRDDIVAFSERARRS